MEAGAEEAVAAAEAEVEVEAGAGKARYMLHSYSRFGGHSGK